VLIRKLASHDPEVRKGARRALREMGPEIVPVLSAALDDRSLDKAAGKEGPRPRGAICKLIGELGGPRAVSALAERLSDPALAGDSADALAQMDDPAAAPALVNALSTKRDPDDAKDHRRLSIAHALRRAARPQAVALVRQRLSREPSATALAKVLVQVLASTPSPEAAEAVAEVFAADRRFDKADFVSLLEPWRAKPELWSAVLPRLMTRWSDDVRAVDLLVLANAAFAAGNRPHPLADRVDDLIRRLDSQAPDVATLCAHALGLIADPGADAALRAKLSEADVWLRGECAFALARRRISEGIAEMHKLAKHAEAGEWAAECLRELGGPATLSLELSPVLAARGKLVVAVTERFGKPPESVEPAGSAVRPWPGRDEPADCHLFRVNSDGAGRTAVAGPVVELIDEPNLSMDDAFALAAGIDLDRQGAIRRHKPDDREIKQVLSITALLAGKPIENRRLLASYRFGGRRTHYVQLGSVEGRPGVLVTADDEAPSWFPLTGPAAEDPTEPARRAYFLHLGRCWFAAHTEPD